MAIPDEKIYTNFEYTIIKALNDVSDFCEKNNFKELDVQILQCILVNKICHESMLQYSNGMKSFNFSKYKDKIKKIVDTFFENCSGIIESKKE